MHGWTENGRLWAGHAGFIYWFETTGKMGNHVKLTHLENLDGDDIPGEGFVVDDLPGPVRKALDEENVRMRSTVTSLEGAMAGD